jgi:hypothetical protein
MWFFWLACIQQLAFSAVPADLVVDVQVEVSGADALFLGWTPREHVQSYRLYRREINGGTWDFLGYALGDSDGYLDEVAKQGVGYEYQIERLPGDDSELSSSVTYVAGGNQVVPMHGGDAVLLAVEETLEEPLAAELARLDADLYAEGWTPLWITVPDTWSDVELKQALLETAADLPVTTVFLIGHVPVPYSGRMNPDGHSDHLGAWPADGFYGDVDGEWSDEEVTVTSASQSRNHNIPGDGKYDQSVFPSELEWAVGRVDFSRLPKMDSDPLVLYQRYFEKNHAFRTQAWKATERAIVDDQFQWFGGEAFATTAWSWTSLVGRSAITEEDWLGALQGEPILFAYGCGAGSNQSARDVATTNELASTEINAVFTGLFGSYFGDWDQENNLLRSALASNGTMLSVSWSGRPKWSFHRMGLGHSIGSTALFSQNSRKGAGFAAGGVHTSLLGDPTVRWRSLAAVEMLTVESSQGDVSVSWQEQPAESNGVYVYRKEGDAWLLRTEEPIAGTSFTDAVDAPGTYQWRVRPVRLEESFSGSYWQLGRIAEVEWEVNCERLDCQSPEEDTGDNEDTGLDRPETQCACAAQGEPMLVFGWMSAILIWLRRRPFGGSAGFPGRPMV